MKYMPAERVLSGAALSSSLPPEVLEAKVVALEMEVERLHDKIDSLSKTVLLLADVVLNRKYASLKTIPEVGQEDFSE